jgi:hypothetical protein
MIYTNKFNLPEPIAKAVLETLGEYDKGKADISVTGLWKPPQIRALMEQFGDTLEQDVSDNIWSVLGSLTHAMLEKAGTNLDSRITEKRFYVEHKGRVISGKPDTIAIDGWILEDYKLTPVYSILKGSRDDEWEKQLNTYAWMLRRIENPIEIKALRVWCILRDWSKAEASRNPDYPQRHCLPIDIPLIDDARMTTLIEEQLATHFDRPPRPCTPEEMWERPQVFAVMKPGAKRAVKLCSSQSEAEHWILTKSKPREEMYVDARPTQRNRCQNYCTVNVVCPQYKAFLSDTPQESSQPKQYEGML